MAYDMINNYSHPGIRRKRVINIQQFIHILESNCRMLCYRRGSNLGEAV